MADNVDKMSRIYTVLTDEEIHAWVNSDGKEMKLPRASVSVAFREAESEFAAFAGSVGGDDTDSEDKKDE